MGPQQKKRRQSGNGYSENPLASTARLLGRVICATVVPWIPKVVWVKLTYEWNTNCKKYINGSGNDGSNTRDGEEDVGEEDELDENDLDPNEPTDPNYLHKCYSDLNAAIPAELRRYCGQKWFQSNVCTFSLPSFISLA